MKTITFTITEKEFDQLVFALEELIQGLRCECNEEWCMNEERAVCPSCSSDRLLLKLFRMQRL